MVTDNINWKQDDLFPPTRNLWKPTVTAAKWLAGEDGTQVDLNHFHSDEPQPLSLSLRWTSITFTFQEWVSLQPEDMRTLSGQAQNVAASSRWNNQQSPSKKTEPDWSWFHLWLCNFWYVQTMLAINFWYLNLSIFIPSFWVMCSVLGSQYHQLNQWRWRILTTKPDMIFVTGITSCASVKLFLLGWNSTFYWYFWEYFRLSPG